MCFPVNFAKFLRIPFLQNISGDFRLQLKILLFSTKAMQKETPLHLSYRPPQH